MKDELSCEETMQSIAQEQPEEPTITRPLRRFIDEVTGNKDYFTTDTVDGLGIARLDPSERICHVEQLPTGITKVWRAEAWQEHSRRAAAFSAQAEAARLASQQASIEQRQIMLRKEELRAKLMGPLDEGLAKQYLDVVNMFIQLGNKQGLINSGLSEEDASWLCQHGEI